MKRFDKEYQTQYVEEMKYLLANGIRYTFVKRIDDIDTYKYKKTPELFKALAIFYEKKMIEDRCFYEEIYTGRT